jgi:hypothetical protein
VAVLSPAVKRKPKPQKPAPVADALPSALLAGLMQGIGEREGDDNMRAAGERLAQRVVEADRQAKAQEAKLAERRKKAKERSA